MTAARWRRLVSLCGWLRIQCDRAGDFCAVRAWEWEKRNRLRGERLDGWPAHFELRRASR